ncbi:hypothetical protein O181_077686 [Austropuccinia psidii MF-1]|uniref:Uncharacterized protein n=1 Tax=Austropuccinia psidii MF-1 TaxID=1389203 RepID=A0A9Q3ICC0_9BASI|nr:hypothetical protein [Austropuccinia psidii MF-1]
MALIDYIDGLFIDVPSIPDYWITASVNTQFKGHVSIWYTEMKEIHGRRRWPWWKSQIIQAYSNDEESQTPETNARRARECSEIEFKEKQPFRVELKDKPRERVAEVAKKQNSCHCCGSTGGHAKNCPKAKKKVYAIEKVQEEESPTEESDSDYMGDAIREKSDEEKDSRAEFLVEYQGAPPVEIKDIQLEAGMPQDTSKKSLCKNTQDGQTLLVTPTKGMAYTHRTPQK